MNTVTLAKKVAYMRDQQKQYFAKAAQARKNKALYPEANEILKNQKHLKRKWMKPVCRYYRRLKIR